MVPGSKTTYSRWYSFVDSTPVKDCRRAIETCVICRTTGAKVRSVSEVLYASEGFYVYFLLFLPHFFTNGSTEQNFSAAFYIVMMHIQRIQFVQARAPDGPTQEIRHDRIPIFVEKDTYIHQARQIKRIPVVPHTIHHGTIGPQSARAFWQVGRVGCYP